MDSLDKKIKEYLVSERKARVAERGLSTRAGYPTDEDLYSFVTDALEGRDLLKMLEYLKSDPRAMELVSTARLLAQEEASSDRQDVPQRLLNDAKALWKPALSANCPHCGKLITPFKKPVKRQGQWNLLWLVLTVAGFGLSFLFHRYFLQYLSLGVLAGFKWIMDRRSLRTQILIYKALGDGGGNAHSHEELPRSRQDSKEIIDR